jgi:hypothetical protein
MIGFQWLRADLDFRVYTESCPLKHTWMKDISLNARELKNILVGGGYTIDLIK